MVRTELFNMAADNRVEENEIDVNDLVADILCGYTIRYCGYAGIYSYFIWNKNEMKTNKIVNS